MADERNDRNRSFADRIGDKVMGSAGDSCPVDFRTEATRGSTAGATPSVTAGAREYSSPQQEASTEYPSAPIRDRAPQGASAFGGATRQSVPSLLRDFSRELATLVRMEAALAKAEMREKTSMLARNSAWVAIGGVLGLAGVIFVLWTAVAALSAIFDVMDVSPRVYTWLSPLIVSAVVLGVSYFLIKKGLDTIKNGSLMPERTAQSLRETGEWVKEKVA